MAFKTKAEKKAFRAGMAKQYNKEHPKFSYAAAIKNTWYGEDGSVMGQPCYNSVSFFKSEKDAKAFVAKNNKKNKKRNDNIMKDVKAKKVNTYGGDEQCITAVAEYKKIKSRRDIKNRPNYTDL